MLFVLLYEILVPPKVNKISLGLSNFEYIVRAESTVEQQNPLNDLKKNIEHLLDRLDDLEYINIGCRNSVL